MKIIPLTDLVISAHPSILKHYSLKDKKKIFYPYKINLNDKKKNKIFGFGGAISKYRKLIFKKIEDLNQNKNIKSEIVSINKEINQAKNNFIINHEKKKYFVFNLHPKKFDSWPYSSPLRYIESINFGEIPVTFDNFRKDGFTEKLTIRINPNKKNSLYKLYKDSVKIKKKFFNKIKKLQKHQNIKYLKFKEFFLNS